MLDWMAMVSSAGWPRWPGMSQTSDGGHWPGSSGDWARCLVYRVSDQIWLFPPLTLASVQSESLWGKFMHQVSWGDKKKYCDTEWEAREREEKCQHNENVQWVTKIIRQRARSWPSFICTPPPSIPQAHVSCPPAHSATFPCQEKTESLCYQTAVTHCIAAQLPGDAAKISDGDNGWEMFRTGPLIVPPCDLLSTVCSFPRLTRIWRKLH